MFLQPRLSQPSPPQPGSHAHTPLSTSQRPCDEHCDGQRFCSHVGPAWEGGQRHDPFEHTPPFWHGPGHARSEQSRPPKPALHSHVPSARHWPLNEHFPGHLRDAHSGPSKPAKQRHVPLKQWPLPAQSLRQSIVPQSGPDHRCSQRHVPVTPSHLPWPEQSRGQSRVAQSAPENPFAQRHAPSTHVPWPEHWPGHTIVSQPTPTQPACRSPGGHVAPGRGPEHP